MKEQTTSTDHLGALEAAWSSQLIAGRARERGSSIYRPTNSYASKRRRCVRAMALDLIHPEDDPFDKPIQFERMTQGNEGEAAVVARLMKIGPRCSPAFTIAEQQHRFELKDRDGTVVITGKMDGRLRFEDGHRPPFEIKQGRSYDHCETVEDLDRGDWSRPAVDQLLSYLYADDPKNHPDPVGPWGFILVRCFSAMPHFIRLNLFDHLARVEGFLKDSRQAWDSRNAKADLPPFIELPSECRRCPHWKKSCDPPIDFGQGTAVVTDPDVIDAIAAKLETDDAATRNRRATELLKKRLRGVELAVAGDFLIEGTPSSYTRYDVPKPIKDQYKVVDPAGKFTLRYTRLTDAPCIRDGAGGVQ
jgi:hypothetical protein